ncbi:MAG: thiol-disulfide oxidoreductase DCC family protein [Deltaproteobacteria bacterium]
MREHPVILFDGVCNLCSGSVSFIIKRDRDGVFKFAPLQSEAGARLIEKFNIQDEGLETFVLVEEENAYTRSTAALRALRRLGGLWGLLYGFIVIPAPLRDAVYDFIARNRYRWFGRKDECMVPGPGIKNRFLD